MPLDDLAQYATSEHDFYGILGTTFETSEADIRRAYRKTALKYHPDKNGGNPAAVEKFHLVQIAYDVLSDAAVKAAYDNARAARVAKQRQKELLNGRRRQMMDDLEKRERGVKRDRDDEVDAEERLRREVARLAEDGKRRRREREEMLRQEKLEQEEVMVEIPGRKDGPASAAADTTETRQAGPYDRRDVSEMDRTIKIRWAREGLGESTDKDTITSLFSKFGAIESTFLLKDKRQRIDGGTSKKKEKRVVATGVVQFSSIVGAHAAVEDFPKQTGAEWAVFESVFWASNKEPDFGFAGGPSATSADSSNSAPSPSSSAKTSEDTPSVPFPGTSDSNINPSESVSHKPQHVPSFSSFPSKHKAESRPNPSLEEMTMIRLKMAQKKRLEDELLRREQEEDQRQERDNSNHGSTVAPV